MLRAPTTLPAGVKAEVGGKVLGGGAERCTQVCQRVLGAPASTTLGPTAQDD